LLIPSVCASDTLGVFNSPEPCLEDFLALMFIASM